MSPEENKMVVRRFFEAIGDGDVEAAAQYLAPDFVMRLPNLPEPVRRPEGFMEMFGELGRALVMKPNFEVLIGEGDMVASRIRFDIKHIGEFQGVPATGKEFVMYENDITRLSNGKIVEHIEEYDTLGFLRNLGIMRQEEEEAVR